MPYPGIGRKRKIIVIVEDAIKWRAERDCDVPCFYLGNWTGPDHRSDIGVLFLV